MHIDKKKKVLYLIGIEHNLDHLMKLETNINPENIIILQSYNPVISQSFGDIMRDIIVAVYQEKVEKIFVVAAKDDQRNTEDIFNIISENKGLQEKIQTLDYLSKYCTPEFPEGSIMEWLEGSKTVTDGVQNSVNIIRRHPLMPSHVKVQGLIINKENDILSEIDTF
ncbi:carbonic anhydrase [Niallia sp. 01092]|uniref:carbonic anhydrase n=1 Tax=unclassified Niallia TaxID=2837522 RepID=UPI003FD22AEA